MSKYANIFCSVRSSRSHAGDASLPMARRRNSVGVMPTSALKARLNGPIDWSRHPWRWLVQNVLLMDFHENLESASHGEDSVSRVSTPTGRSTFGALISLVNETSYAHTRPANGRTPCGLVAG